MQWNDETDTAEKKPISEEGNLLDLHVAGIKTESVDHSYDLTSDIKVEETPVPTNFVTTICKAEEELCDLDTVKDELKVEVTEEENEILTDRFAATNERTVSAELDDNAHQETETLCEIPRIHPRENLSVPSNFMDTSRNKLFKVMSVKRFSLEGPLISLANTHFGAYNVKPIPEYIRIADSKNGKTAAETVGILRKAFNYDALGKSHVYEWFSHFKSGNMSSEDMPRSRRPLTGRNDENIAEIKRAIDEDRRKTIDDVSDQTNL
ncbi:hypothetical protein ANN_27781 [Periplaneta americana]|uniref:Mos1 transposase HTH domain-containing protein n=1 Tax=Periplaneta americana TaxID=6978 RepID=A0ABQ8RVA0_PERAM|nr:hypothetical protein ANN_27781 [Periplaneta americana]